MYLIYIQMHESDDWCGWATVCTHGMLDQGLTGQRTMRTMALIEVLLPSGGVDTGSIQVRARGH